MAGYLLLIFVFVFPILATVFELVAFIIELFRMSEKEKYKNWFIKHKRIARKSDRYSRWGFLVEIPLYGLCFFLEFAFLEVLTDVVWGADWTSQLANSQKHQPISTEHLPAVILVIVVYLVGLTVLYLTKTNKTPPLVTAISISALYLGTAYSLIWTIHLWPVLDGNIVYLGMLPLNTILISARLILKKTKEYRPDPERMSKIIANSKLDFINWFVGRAEFIPIAGLILIIPLLGVMVIILVVFGQAPDAAIKAFTETSDFLLSTKVSPQNIVSDEHYLCTVAAGGDRKIVKPLRRGVRHGHEVTVNRQLEIANAFEEIIMVHTPLFHKHIRHFYDTYGFPVARLIKKKWVADMVYYIMKPLEFMFWVVLYLTEIHPEDRIALQYTGTTLERFYER